MFEAFLKNAKDENIIVPAERMLGKKPVYCDVKGNLYVSNQDVNKNFYLLDRSIWREIGESLNYTLTERAFFKLFFASYSNSYDISIEDLYALIIEEQEEMEVEYAELS